MGLDLNKIISDVFSTVGNVINSVLKTVTYTHHVSDGVYDPVSDTTIVVSDTYVLNNAILTSFKDKEKVAEFSSIRQRGTKISPEVGDMKLLIPYDSLPIQPTHQDKVEINNVEWEVIGFSHDPTETALITLLIRSS